MSSLIVHFRWEDETARERTGHTPSHAEAENEVHNTSYPIPLVWLASFRGYSSYQHGANEQTTRLQWHLQTQRRLTWRRPTQFRQKEAAVRPTAAAEVAEAGTGMRWRLRHKRRWWRSRWWRRKRRWRRRSVLIDGTRHRRSCQGITSYVFSVFLPFFYISFFSSFLLSVFSSLLHSVFPLFFFRLSLLPFFRLSFLPSLLLYIVQIFFSSFLPSFRFCIYLVSSFRLSFLTTLLPSLLPSVIPCFLPVSLPSVFLSLLVPTPNHTLPSLLLFFFPFYILPSFSLSFLLSFHP